MATCRIVIADSGLRPDCFDQYITAAYTVHTTEEGCTMIEGAEDSLGHGTAVYDLLSRYAQDFSVTVIKAFEDSISTDFDKICFILEYIYEHIPCDIIHLSLGANALSDCGRLLSIVRLLAKRGTLIVSALDNNEVISYPAALEEVIGVDTSKEVPLEKETDYALVEGDVIDVLSFGGYLRTKWLNPPRIIIKGTSFSSAIITAHLANLINTHGPLTKEKAMELLRENAVGVLDLEAEIFPNEAIAYDYCSSFRKAVLFPCNKEMHSLIAWNSLLPFEIQGIYDIRYTGNIGKPIAKMVPYGDSHIFEDATVADYTTIDWEGDWDAFICGHCGPINEKAKRNVLQEIIDLCATHGKKLFCFDWFEIDENILKHYGREFVFPYINESSLPVNRFGKLRYSGIPVAAIMGTSSAQGKFTLQLELRKRFLKDGYHLGQIGTEPSSQLFGMQRCFPMGYNSSVFLSPRMSVPVLNEMIWDLEREDCDIVLIGCQSGTISYDNGNFKRLTFESYEFLIGVAPDVSILCVNAHDDGNYLKRTIGFIESVTGNPVQALCLYPITKEATKLGYGFVNKPLSPEELITSKEKLSSLTGKPVYTLGDEKDMDLLYDALTDFFCETAEE